MMMLIMMYTAADMICMTEDSTEDSTEDLTGDLIGDLTEIFMTQ
mgnify:CR=1 FL=1